MRRRIAVFLALAVAPLARAQDLEDPDADLPVVLARWAAAFDARDLDPRGDFRLDLDIYGRLARDAGVLSRFRTSADVFSNQRMLERLVEAAERMPDAASAHGILEVAGVGLDRSPFDGDAQVVRDVGLAAAMRVAATPEFAAVVAATAAGEDFDEWSPTVGARVAALRLLAVGSDAEGLDALVAGLTADDPRVRLAAAESLQRRAAPEVLDELIGALAEEAHPVAAQAIVQAIGAVLDARGADLDAVTTERAMSAVVRRLGAIGWRTDVDVVDLVARHPTRSSVPALIELLDPKASRRMRARDREFAPVLHERARAALRRITGTLLPRDDVAAWRAFWVEHGASIELVARPAAERAGGTTTGGFFGIEVRGRETAFVLDVSNSMREHIRGSGADAGSSRLEVATRQLLEVAQDMPRAWRFRVVTFADTARVWNVRGARADARTMRALTAFLADQRPGGRTNLRAALRLALGVEEQRFGVESRNPVDEVFVLSDGLPADADGPIDPDAMLAWVREVNRYQKVRIHAVLAGAGPGEDLLRRLARENGGEFVQR